MPRIMAPAPESRGLACHYYPLGLLPHVLGNARGFDTDEKWVEIYVFSEMRKADGTSRFMTSNKKIVTTRLYIDYDVVDKETGEVLYSVRQ
jgi:hypothetical protein